MTDAIIQGFWYVGLGVIVAAMLAGLAKQQLYEYRVNKRVRKLGELRRRR